ncbi:MAG: hypothetical protein ABS939_08300 [Psychrobacillus sp.]
MDFLENERVTDYDRIFITDISFNDEVAERLDMIHRGGVSTVQLIDHHATALHLAEKYSWCEVRVEESNLFEGEDLSRKNVKSSGTSLFYKFLRNKHLPSLMKNPKLKRFVDNVRLYDTWEWTTVYNYETPKKLNDLLYIIGREKFIDRFVSEPLPLFTNAEKILLEIEEHRINKYIWKKKQDIELSTLVANNKVYKFAYVFAEQNSSLLGNAIAKELGDAIDFVAIIDIGNNKVSLRGIHDSIDLGKDIARLYSGGGHPKSAGFETNELLKRQILNSIFKNYDSEDN